MTAPLDLEAVKRRHDALQNADEPSDCSLAMEEAHHDRQDLIAEVERLTFDLEQQRIDNKRLRNDLTESEMDRQQAEAKVEDQNERIAQLHRERGEAFDKADRMSGALGCEQARTRDAERARDSALDRLRQAQNAAEKAYRERDAAWARLGGLR